MGIPFTSKLWRELHAIASGLLRPRSVWGWIRLSFQAVAFLIPSATVVFVLWQLIAHPWTLGMHAWDSQETQRYVVRKAILTYHQFPFWDPYTCGGHSAWDWLESDPIVVSPWLPAYLGFAFPVALRIEIIGLALWGALGAWVLASRFTSSWALRSFVAVVAWTNGRWGVQVGAGHVWHLLFSFMPWILFFFDSAIERRSSSRGTMRQILGVAVCLALMVYMGGIYPVPHVAVILAIYALALSAMTRSARPIGVLVACGALAVGLSAPRLLPFLAFMRRFPRLTEPGEVLGIDGLLHILTDPGPLTDPIHARVPGFPGMWHEWGCYIGWPALLVIVAGFFGRHSPRVRAMGWAALVVIGCALGPFSKYAPWTLMHELPLFRSQHVPSRWAFSALLPAACVAMARVEGLLRRSGRARAVFEVVLTCCVAFVASQIAAVSRRPLVESFDERVPDLQDSTASFHTVERTPELSWDHYAWGFQALPNVIRNVGSIQCNTVPAIHSDRRDAHGHMPGLGARGEGDPEYKGETYVDEGHGSAAFTSWSPNRVEVRVTGAQRGDHLVLNQNWDSGWTANGRPVTRWRDCVSVVLDDSTATVTFEYRPPMLLSGLGVLGLTLAGLGWAFARTRERSRAAGS